VPTRELLSEAQRARFSGIPEVEERELARHHTLSEARRATAGLNKGEARNALARAVFFNRLGEMRDRSHEDQIHWASGLNVLCAAIALWNIVYVERAVEELRNRGHDITDEHLRHLSPLGWEHIALTGVYRWDLGGVPQGVLRPLRS
jgi:hypothetical protein